MFMDYVVAFLTMGLIGLYMFVIARAVKNA